MKIILKSWLLAVVIIAGCNRSGLPANDLSVDVLPYNMVATFDDSSFKKQYQFNSSINPFYISGNFDGDNQTDYAVYLYNKASKAPAIAFVLGEHSIIKEVKSFSCFHDTDIKFWKETNRFPSGSGLPAKGGGIVAGLKNGEVRWLYWDGKDWICKEPD